MRFRPFVCALACLAASCAYVEATTTRYDGVAQFPRGDPAAVQVLYAEPRERHDRLGEVRLDLSVDPPAELADIQRKLREETARMGGNAVYIVRDAVVPRAGRQLVGIVIRYRQ